MTRLAGTDDLRLGQDHGPRDVEDGLGLRVLDEADQRAHRHDAEDTPAPPHPPSRVVPPPAARQPEDQRVVELAGADQRPADVGGSPLRRPGTPTTTAPRYSVS
jgi:hypothetical protein